MLEPGGVFLAWQSSLLPETAPEIRKALEQYGSRAEENFAYRLPNGERDRFILVFRKSAV